MEPERTDPADHAGHRWVHTAEAVLLLSAAVFACAAVMPGTSIPRWAPPVAEIGLGAVICLSVWAATGRGKLAMFSLTSGLFYGLWTVWAEAGYLWHAITVAAMIGATVVFIPWGTMAMASHHRPQLPALPGPDPDLAAAAERAQYETMLEEAGQGGVQVVKVAKTRGGRVVTLQLPRSGAVTLATLQQVTGRLEVTLQAQPGAIEFAMGAHSAEVTMKIREQFVLNEIKTLPPGLRAKTVREPFAIGWEEDGSVLSVKLRDIHMFIVGTTGAGKSNLINVLIAQLASCVDTVIWGIDLKGGRTFRPWLQAWEEGKVERPPIDWIATTREEAALMMETFLLAMETRMKSGKGGMKINPSASTPQIVLIVDEPADILGYAKGGRSEVGPDGKTNQWFIGKSETIAQKARSEAGASIWATQRGTNDMSGSGTLKSLCKLRICLDTTSEADMQYVIPDAKAAQRIMANAPDVEGLLIVAQKKRHSQLSRSFHLDHIEDVCSEGDNDGCVAACPVYQASIYVGGARPLLDAMTAEPLGEPYTGRWTRASQELGRRFPVSGTATAAVDTEEFDYIMSRAGFKDADEDDGRRARRIDPRRIRYREILRARGPQGATPGHLLAELLKEGNPPAREVLQRWLAEDALDGMVHSVEDEYGRWKWGPDPKARGSHAA